MALRAGAFAPLMRSQTLARPAIVISSRNITEQQRKLEADWDKAKKIYYGPERDYKNFPHPVQQETPPPTRMGLFPETWFKAFYDKTGVTGPYMFGVGTIAFLLSKEIWVIEHGFVEFISFFGGLIFLAKKLGPSLADMLNDMDKQYREKYWFKPMQEHKEHCQQYIDDLKKAIWREEGQRYLYESKRENVDLQLEAIYRERVAEVYRATKRKLSYQMDLQSAKRKFEQDHMVEWVVKRVREGITAKHEKETIAQCINDIRMLQLEASVKK